jgi:hypothetical protein
MTIEMLKESYKDQLVKAGVEPQRAMQVAASITPEELNLIGEIWADWGEVVQGAVAGNPSRMTKLYK